MDSFRGQVDGCAYTREIATRCAIRDGERECEKFTRVMRQCPGRPLEEVESKREVVAQEGGHKSSDDSSFDQMLTRDALLDPFSSFFGSSKTDDVFSYRSSSEPEQQDFGSLLPRGIIGSILRALAEASSPSMGLGVLQQQFSSNQEPLHHQVTSPPKKRRGEYYEC
eukprot:TRINITY_DN113215_c0_g1_i1.p1 TRINITY_DN113215_c0_g1~~TRINITY_DN113215_c0_g1_i1.p1  ORF type:complete len:167 (+),score=13.70 TRINITY_DN113215_c0_g1_i1:27-527(+)